MPRPLLPCKWNTERLRLSDSTFDEAPILQQINDAVPQTRDCMRVEGQEIGHNSMISVLNEGYLPPIPTKSKEYFRLQSIRIDRSNELIGFLAVYHGFPNDDIFWISAITFQPKDQGKGYGPELMKMLCKIVQQLGSYSRIRTYVSLDNWPSLRLCVKVGLNKMVEIAGDKVHSDEAVAHVLLEKEFNGA